MFNTVSKFIDVGLKYPVELQTGKIARQADGAVLVRCGETVILCTVVYNKSQDSKNDFFPLTVVYQEKYSSIGKIPGGFLKRESKPSDDEILTSRLIDRSIRPLFDPNFINDTQVVCTVFGYEKNTHPDFLSLLGTIAALKISGAPIMDSVCGVKIGLVNDKFVLNPSSSDLQLGDLDMFLSATKSSVFMVEAKANQLTEEKTLEAINFGLEAIRGLIDEVEDFASRALMVTQKPPFVAPKLPIFDMVEKIQTNFTDKIRDAYDIPSKQERYAALSDILNSIETFFAEQSSSEGTQIDKNLMVSAFKEVQKNVMRSNILEKGKRADGRNTKQIRNIEIELDILPSTHGSALFTRGESQALVSLTIGSSQDEQMIDTLDGLTKSAFMLHYNFPSYSVGEIGRFSGPGRREIGHGNLARKSILPLLPSKRDFGQTIRIVSDITESNGSTSMATVCGATLALISGGVPMPAIVGGIAMGLIKSDSSYAVLSDILGDEDFLGDMDFKVAGTRSGITALQMDVKILGISLPILQDALNQAKEGRVHIISKMENALEGLELAEQKPKAKFATLTIPKEKIRLVIGSGGSVIKDLCLKTESTIDIDNEGNVKVVASDPENISKAVELINALIAEPKEELKVGKVYAGIVSKIIDHGAIISLIENQSGLVHLSELAINKVDRVRDVVLEGESVKVQLVEVDNTNGRLKLRLKGIDQETGNIFDIN